MFDYNPWPNVTLVEPSILEIAFEERTFINLILTDVMSEEMAKILLLIYHDAKNNETLLAWWPRKVKLSKRYYTSSKKSLPAPLNVHMYVNQKIQIITSSILLTRILKFLHTSNSNVKTFWMQCTYHIGCPKVLCAYIGMPCWLAAKERELNVFTRMTKG